MTKTEAALRAALNECLALIQQDPKSPKSYKVDVAIGNAKRALDMEVTPTPVFYPSGKFVRGPSRPEGSGFKEMVFRLSSETLAERTADNLSSLFAAHCVTLIQEPSAQAQPAKAPATPRAVAARRHIIFTGVPLVGLLKVPNGWQIQQCITRDSDDWSDVPEGFFHRRSEAEDAAPTLCGF